MNDNKVFTWGLGYAGGDSSSVASQLDGTKGPIKHIYSNWNSYTALKEDGTIVTWGYHTSTGSSGGGFSRYNPYIGKIKNIYINV